jgi:hypothetical protein
MLGGIEGVYLERMMGIVTVLTDLKHRIRARIPLDIQDSLSIRRRKARHEARIMQDPDAVLVVTGNDRRTEAGNWFRGEQVNFMPSRTNLFEKNAIEDYVLKGWMPEKPFITKNDYITAFGSCFAAYVTQFLLEQGYRVFGDDTPADSYVIRCGEGMANSFAVAQQFQWAYGEKEFDESLWFDKDATEASYDSRIREHTRAIFEQTDVFIFTLGISEVWYNKQNGDVFWRAVPRSKYDPARHGFKVATVDENRANLEIVHRIIRARRPNAAIIFTVSPVPLLATFRPVSCITANTVSKAILRVAVDEFIRAHPEDKQMFYYPSYEIIKEYFRDPYRGDNRHIHNHLLKKMMRGFVKHFLM